jgi:ATP-binding cassette, subfamily B, bacterial
VALSGGQWQRVALARALMRTGSDLMILDEPSAGLDAEAEYEIHTTLRAHRTGRTSLLISHRLSAVRGADRIVVLDGGEPVEEGTHDELMTRDGLYARLFRTQAAGYASDGPAPSDAPQPTGSGGRVPVWSGR